MLDLLASLADEVIKLENCFMNSTGENCLMTVNGTDCPVTWQGDIKTGAFYLHKFKKSDFDTKLVYVSKLVGSAGSMACFHVATGRILAYFAMLCSICE